MTMSGSGEETKTTTAERLRPKLLNPLTLAFFGDSVYEQLVREHIVFCHQSLSPNRLHFLASGLVCASAQSRAYEILEPLLTEDELSILKRGRNANGVTPPKNAKTSDYRRATGVEALFGFLHLSGDRDRIRELFERIIESTEETSLETEDIR